MPRRLLIVVLAIAISAAILRTTLSSALVSRGDELSYSGKITSALQKYMIAERLDPRNAVAVDRFAFGAIRSHNRHELHEAVEMIAGGPRQFDSTLAMDLALCRHLLGDFREASLDFERAAHAKRDGRAMLFAAFDARRAREIKKARELVSLAVAYDPSFAPARAAKERSTTW